MPVNSASVFPKSALTVLLAGCLGGLILFPSARAQEGVAGDNPVVSKPKQEQPADAKSVKNEAQIRVQANLVTAPVTVINSNGDFVFDLEEKDFEVLDNDVRQHIDQFSLELHSLAAVIVVETNSTSGPLLDEVRPLGPVFSGLMLGPQGRGWGRHLWRSGSCCPGLHPRQRQAGIRPARSRGARQLGPSE